MRRLTQKKGQAAMEFLMTYGWAILAAIIAIGVLAYFGVFRPTVPQGTGTLTAPYSLDAFSIEEGENDGFSTGDNFTEYDHIRLEVTQSIGDTVEVFEIEIEGSGPSSGDAWYWYNTTAAPNTSETTHIGGFLTPGPQMISGQRYLFIANSSNQDDFTDGDNVAGDITLRYSKAGSSLPQVSTGRLTGTAITA